MTQRSIPIPSLMRNLPRDTRGWPITYTSLILPDGRHDFTQADTYIWRRCVKDRLCALCGNSLTKKMWFIGGPLSMVNRFFFDLGMHEECARYALLVCPYLAVRGYGGVKKRAVGAHEVAQQKVLASSNLTRPEAFGLAMTDGYTPVVLQGDELVRAKRWMRPIEWWFGGERVAFDYEAYKAKLTRITE